MAVLNDLVARLLRQLASPEYVRSALEYGLRSLSAAAAATKTSLDDFLVAKALEAVADEAVFAEIYEYTVGLLLRSLSDEHVVMAAAAAPQGVSPEVWSVILAVLMELVKDLVKKWLNA